MERSPIALFESLMAEAEEEHDAWQLDLRKLREGIAFFRYLYARISDYASLKRDDLFDETGAYGQALLRIRADYQAYLRDLPQGRRFMAALAHCIRVTVSPTPGLTAVTPRSPSAWWLST